MPARAIWRGIIVYGDNNISVKLYSAVQDTNIHFNLLHDRDHVRLKRRLVNSTTGNSVSKEDIHKAFEVESGIYIKLTDSELKSLKPSASRDINANYFVDLECISQQWYERPYYLMPDESSMEDYHAFAEVLAERHKAGVVHWVMRNKRYIGALQSSHGILILISLRHSNEIISPSSLIAPQGDDLNSDELKMAEKLIYMMKDEFTPADYSNKYRDRVYHLIESKRKGRKINLKKYRQRHVDSKKTLAESLRDSLENS